MNIDKLDLKLILELENDSRISISKISKNIKASQQLVSFRLAKLKENKIIKNFTTIINYNLLNYRLYKIYIKLSNTNSNKLEEIINYIKNKQNINYICECCNYFDLNIELISKNIINLDNFITNLRNKYYLEIKDYIIIESLKTIYLDKDYLDFRNNFRKINTEQIIENKPNSKKIKLDDLRKKILKEYTNNTRIQCIELCKKFNQKPTDMIKILNEFKDKKILLKNTVFLDLNKLKIHKYNILFKFKKINSNFEDNFIKFIKNIQNITEISKIIGTWDIEVKIEIENKDDISEILRIIKNEYYNNIDNIELISISNENKLNYL